MQKVLTWRGRGVKDFGNLLPGGVVGRDGKSSLGWSWATGADTSPLGMF